MISLPFLPPLPGRDLRDIGLNAEAEGHANTVVGAVIVGVARTAHTAETVGVAGIRRPLPPPIPLTILLALAIFGIFLPIPLIPETFMSTGINLATIDFLLREYKNMVDGLTKRCIVCATGTGQLLAGLDNSFQIIREHGVEKIAIQYGTKFGLLPPALVRVTIVHNMVFIQGFHRLEGDGN